MSDFGKELPDSGTYDELEGIVEEIIFQNASNSYTVFELDNGNGFITCKGIFPGLSNGATIKVRGNYEEHPTYGLQLAVTSYEETEPKGTENMRRYLGSGAIKGIGQALANRIVRKFGDQTFYIMENEPERLAEVKGISLNKAMEIADQMVEKRDIRAAMMYLAEYGIQGGLALKLYERYGASLKETLEKNPYKIAEDIRGVGFRTADEIAKKLGVSADSEYRLRCGIVYALGEAVGRGHTYLPKEELFTEVESLLGTEVSGYETQLENLLMDRKIRVIDGENVYLNYMYFLENDSAAMLLERDSYREELTDRIRNEIHNIEESTGMDLDEKQREAVYLAATSGIFILTGGPGTGKTTTIRVIIEYFRGQNKKVFLGAPTGRAAKRMTEATGYGARTIHRMLEVRGAATSDQEMGDWEEGSGHFERNDENPLECDVVIIDEMSMVDLSLFHALLNALPPKVKLILVGDVNQLPSVGAGNVLHDLIDSGAFETVMLEKIFRQAEESGIVVNAHKINRGEEISFDKESEDFLFVSRGDPKKVVNDLLLLAEKNIPNHFGIDPKEVQVLTPTRKGPVGVENLNIEFQKRLNPSSRDKTEYIYGDHIFREGDKVMQIRNNYQLEWIIKGTKGITVESGTGVFNGDTGIVQTIDLYASTLTVAYDDNRLVEYNLKDLSDLELAYAITVHKSQGSEYPVVLIPMLQVPRPLMNRNILYTAITRARECVVLIGGMDVFQTMVMNERGLNRYSGLVDRIESRLKNVQ